MSSVSSITRQYANLQSKRHQKRQTGGGIFDGILGGGDKKEEPVAPDAAPAAAPAADDAAAAVPAGDDAAAVAPADNSPSLLEKLGLSSPATEPKPEEAVAATLETTEEPPKEKSFLQKLGITSSDPEPAAAPAAEPAPAVRK